MASKKTHSSGEDHELVAATNDLSLDEEGGSKGREKKDIHRPGISEETPPPKPEKLSKGTKSIRPTRLTFSPTTSGSSKSSSEEDNSLANDGELMEKHTWKGEVPDFTEPFSPRISRSAVYTPNEKHEGKKEDTVDIRDIDVPKAIYELTGRSCREALQSLLNHKEDVRDFPHTKEIIQEKEEAKKDKQKDKPSIRTGEKKEEEKYKAFSSPQHSEAQPDRQRYFYLDCEYMLHMYLPESFNSWFEIEEERKYISAVSNNDKRWIFIPSYRRADIALMDWPEDEIITQDSTIRILVVRPYEFEKYVKNHGHTFPVISLPQEEIGVGYARFWIQKIATRLSLQFIWVIDDSVECFYEYDPQKKRVSYKKERRRKFGLVFERIEKLVKASETNGEHHIAAMSPRRWRPVMKTLTKPFACKPPQCAVYLNILRLKEKEVHYRPELQTCEDIYFAYECENNGLKVFVDNRIHLQDHNNWSKTGARSDSIQQKKTEA